MSNIQKALSIFTLALRVEGRADLFLDAESYNRLQYELQQIQHMPDNRSGVMDFGIVWEDKIKIMPEPYLRGLEREITTLREENKALVRYLTGLIKEEKKEEGNE